VGEKLDSLTDILVHHAKSIIKNFSVVEGKEDEGKNAANDSTTRCKGAQVVVLEAWPDAVRTLAGEA
jgi:hypothetical protein